MRLLIKAGSYESVLSFPDNVSVHQNNELALIDLGNQVPEALCVGIAELANI